jgi:hypothetical protein
LFVLPWVITLIRSRLNLLPKPHLPRRLQNWKISGVWQIEKLRETIYKNGTQVFMGPKKHAFFKNKKNA